MEKALSLPIMAIVLISVFYLLLIYFPLQTNELAVKPFSSLEEFKAYLQESKETNYYGGSLYSAMAQPGAMPARSTAESSVDIPKEAIKPSRVSETNVQVLGIDEPDLVKTNGNQIFFSDTFPGNYYRYFHFEPVTDLYEQNMATKVIDAYPPKDLKVIETIDKSGKLLLHEDTLIIISRDGVYGYDVSSPENPKQAWKIELNSSFVSARLYGGKIYLVTRNTLDEYSICPIIPLTKSGTPVQIGCSQIYHPRNKIPVDRTYNIFLIDPKTGDVYSKVSLIGSADSSIVYMSKNSIYITYYYYTDIIDFFYKFINENCKDIFPQSVIQKIKSLKEYDISNAAKLAELEIIFGNYLSTLTGDERLKFTNELSNRMETYYEKHGRELEKTGITKVSLNLEILTTNHVPGKLLNQFSMDEYEGNLRVATTIRSGENKNDLYILNENLEIIGKIQDYGLDERIYAVRFIGDQGYVVTFKQIDPFFVMDLSDPENPKIKGELKIPGYSSYLHPLAEDKLLGIGEENRKVKLSLFDVSSPENPKEITKYQLDDYWSEISSTHHAFLLDKKHEIFFLPGSRGGYIFSYAGDVLKLEKAVSDILARRAVYIEDYLYIIGDEKIVVLDETDWSKVNELYIDSL